MRSATTHQLQLSFLENDLPFSLFPTTRYQGSKRKLLKALYDVFSNLTFKNALDLYSGSSMVTLLLRSIDKEVYSNDYLKYNQVVADLFLSCKRNDLQDFVYKNDINWLLNEAELSSEPLVYTNFQGIYFNNLENRQIDRFCQNINNFRGIKRKLYIYALGQALLMKRPYNLFHRANLQMRERTVSRSFGNAKTWETPINVHMEKILERIKLFPFPVKKNQGKAFNYNTLDLAGFPKNIDLIYLDPPYLNRNCAAIDYAEFYHFLEGLCEYSLFSKGDEKYSHKPIVKMDSAWNGFESSKNEIRRIAEKWPKAIIVISYRSDGFPTKDEMVEILKEFSRKTHVIYKENYKYVLSNVKDSSEQILISIPTKFLSLA